MKKKRFAAVDNNQSSLNVPFFHPWKLVVWLENEKWEMRNLKTISWQIRHYANINEYFSKTIFNNNEICSVSFKNELEYEKGGQKTLSISNFQFEWECFFFVILF